MGRVASEFGVTVRTLHHYDDVGLLRPSERSASGYRLYTDEDLLRLRQIVAYRRLGFSLEDVASVLESGADPVTHLQRQREAVSQRISELGSLSDALDRAMEAEMTGYQITTEEQREIFGESFSDEYAAEAQERWGDTDARAQSAQRTKQYGKDQWQQVKDETDEINDDYAALLTAGEPATGEQAMDVAERARQQITRWFYDCPPRMHADIAQMYVEDPRFRAGYENHTEGLSVFVRDAVQANAERQEG